MGFGQETPHDAIHDDDQQNSLLNAYSTHNYVIEYTTDTSGTQSRDCKSLFTDASTILEEKEVPDAYIVSTKMAEGGSSPGSPSESNVEGDSEVSSDSDKESIKREIIEKLDNLKPLLSSCDDIYDIFYDTPLHCLRESTQEKICFMLDPISDVQTDEDQLLKDYRGLAEWVNQEPAFIRYLTKCMILRKTSEVIGKWITTEDEDPKPTIGNFRKCMVEENGIDRPDVITDLAPFICKDAFDHEMAKYEARTTKPVVRDTSWQLTRHDVVTGKKTYYTCCLVYADEDEGMAQVITKLYRTVRRGALFFLPQFDLKQGKYIYDTTAKVIEERCNGKVIFILSEYFFASHVCQFAVQFAAALAQGAGNGNLIPFHLTNKLDHVPAVLKGIAGIRWFRRATRKHVWDTMTDTILGGEVGPDEMEELKTRIETIIEKDESIYLADAPYDTDTPSPGKPIEIIEPENSKNLFPSPDDWTFEPIPSRPSKFKQFINFLSKKKNKLRHAFGKKNASSDSPHSSMSPQSTPIVRGEIEASATGSSSRSSIEIAEVAIETTASSSAKLCNSDVSDNSVATNSLRISTGASNTQTCVNGNGNESKPTKYVSSSETEHNSDSTRSMHCEHQCSVNTPQNKQDVQEQVNEQHRNHRLNILESDPKVISLQDLSSTQQREPTEHEEDHTVLYRRQNTRRDGDVGGDRQETLSLVENEDTFHSCDDGAV